MVKIHERAVDGWGSKRRLLFLISDRLEFCAEIRRIVGLQTLRSYTDAVSARVQLLVIVQFWFSHCILSIP